jgi:hypothetical protein
LRMMEATVFLGTFNAAEMFWYPSPDLFSDKNHVSELDRKFLRPFQIMPNQLNSPQVDSNKVVEPSQG